MLGQGLSQVRPQSGKLSFPWPCLWTGRTQDPSATARSRLAKLSGVLRHSPWDALFVLLAALHGFVLLWHPSLVVIALGVWWNSNTIAHNFVHQPFFVGRFWNRLFSVYLSVLLGIPQKLWRDRHLAHHAGVTWRLRRSRELVAEVALVATLWGILLSIGPFFFLTVYLPGLLLGLALCALHGRYEHVRGAVSHYGRLYNWLFFNDGYHVEHHSNPRAHWTRLPQSRTESAPISRWPAVLRWLEVFSLDSLERLVLRFPCMQRFVLERHEKAFRELLPALPEIRRIGIVGGGLFPRTALILRRLLPHAELTIIDASLENLQIAKTFLNGEARYVHRLCTAPDSLDQDLIIVPLSYIGNRSAMYRQAKGRAILVHDWIWRRHGQSAVVSWAILKRLNLVQG